MDAELYSGLKGGLVIVWDLESSKVKYNLQGHSSPVTSIAMAKCENIPTFLLTAALDGKIKWWDIRTKGTPMNIKGHLETVRSLSISPDCKYVASGSDDGLVRLWDIRANKMLKEFSIQDQGSVNSVEFNPHAVTLAYGANDRTVKHWDLERYSLISVTALDRLPIMKVKFDVTGKNLFSATNESLKYWIIDDEEPKLLYLAEAGWNKLQDLQYVNEEAVYGLNIFGNKIGYWMAPWDNISDSINTTNRNNVNKNIPNSKRANSEVMSDMDYINNNIIAKQINNMQKNINSSIISTTNCNNDHSILADFYTTESIVNSNQNDNVFMKNGLNIMNSYNKDYFNDDNMNINKNEIILQKNVVINNINSNININESNIMNNLVNDSMQSLQFDADPLINFNLNMNNVINRRNSDNVSFTHITTNTSFNSINTNEPMNLDLNKFLQVNPDETIHHISQTNDLPLIQEINDQHNVIKNVIAKRFNALKMVSKWWSESNISSTLNALHLMKDLSILNDFFNFAFISRDDIYKIPFNLEHAVAILPHIYSLINSKYEAYCVTGCKTGLILLKIFSEKISFIKSSNKSNNSNYAPDLNKEERLRKCENIIFLFNKTFGHSNLAKLTKRTKNTELCKLANSFYTDLEFFLKPYF
jgi:hypothetical protein